MLDYLGSPSLGKPVGQDLTEQKITLPLLGAISACPEREAEIRAMIGNIPGNPSLKEDIIAFVKEYNGIEYASAKADQYVQMACIALRPLKKGKAKDCLTSLAEYITGRNK